MQCPPTSDGAEGVEVLGGEQRSGQFPDELLEQRRGVVWTHLVPADLPRVEVGLQVLLQQLHAENNETTFSEQINRINTIREFTTSEKLFDCN